MRLVNRFCFAVLAGLVLVGSALGARDPGALGRVAERHRRRLVRERARPRSGARPASGTGRPPDRRAPRRRAAPAGQRRALCPARRRRARHRARRARDGARLARRARSRRPCRPACPTSGSTRPCTRIKFPPAVAQAAAGFTIAVIDTGADLGAPDLSAKAPQTYSVRSGRRTSPTRTATARSSRRSPRLVDERRRDRRRRRRRGLMVVQAGGAGGAFTDVDEAAAIVYAVDHGARIVNLSLGGPTTSSIEKRAVDYAVAKGALLVAAVGNGYLRGNAVEYPAALLQPVGSNGVGGRGLAVAASTIAGRPGARSPAPARTSRSRRPASASSAPSPPPRRCRAIRAPTSRARSAASTATAAAPRSRRRRSPERPRSSGRRTRSCAPTRWRRSSSRRPPATASWNAELGYGVLDVAAAVARAQVTPSVPAQAVALPRRSGRPRAAAREARRHARRPLVARVGERRTLPRLRAVGTWPAARSDRSRHPAERRVRPRSGRVQLHRRRARR